MSDSIMVAEVSYERWFRDRFGDWDYETNYEYYPTIETATRMAELVRNRSNKISNVKVGMVRKHSSVLDYPD